MIRVGISGKYVRRTTLPSSWRFASMRSKSLLATFFVVYLRADSSSADGSFTIDVGDLPFFDFALVLADILTSQLVR
jgi:hypothetical protein